MFPPSPLHPNPVCGRTKGAVGALRRLPPATAQSGTTFVELMGAITIVALATLVMLHQLSISYREGSVQQDRLWAYEKGTQLLAELQAGIERGAIADAEALHAVADRVPNPVMTTITDSLGQPLAPDHPMSGNWRRFDRWVWHREIEVTAPPGQDRLRYVKIRLSKTSDNGVVHLVTALTQVFPLPRRTWPSTVVHDVYLLACAEAPSLLAPWPQLRTDVEAALRRASSEAPSVAFRLHWITRLGYGRDPLYTPYVNVTSDVADAALHAYWYPHRLDASKRLFTPEYFTGRYRTEGGVANDYDSTTRPHPHSIADQFNHCLRLPEARKLFAARVAAGLEKADEPPLQILLADMLEAPERYRGAIFLNLHGDAMPFPPMRNYSDAARAPEIAAGDRVVTHPVRLRTARDLNGDGNNGDGEDLELRVYAWREAAGGSAAVMSSPITVQIHGGDFRPYLQVRRLPGGVNTANGQAGPVVYSGFDSAAGNPPGSSTGNFDMWCETGFNVSPPYTWVRLHNTPAVAPAVGTQGLASAHRLYGYEYVPGPTLTDLDVLGTGPKNTARWRIRIQRAAIGGALPNVDQAIQVSTRIGTDLTTGAASPVAHQPLNLSVTHAWVTRDASAVPMLERFQLLGDPRHSPYLDLAPLGIFGNGYNPYFAGAMTTLDAAVWGLSPIWVTPGGFADSVCFDAPRMLQIWREALQTSGIVFTNLSGPLANRILLGGELAEAQGGSPGKVVMPGAWFGTSGSVLVDSVTSGGSVAAAPPTEPMAQMVGEQLVVASSGPFWAKPWLGELSPDASYSSWYATGNLTTGFTRIPRGSSTPAGLPPGAVFFGLDVGATLGEIGGQTLLQSTFEHVPQASGVAILTRPGSVVPRLFGFLWGANPLSPWHWTTTGVPVLPAPMVRFPIDFPPQILLRLEQHMNSNVTGLNVGGLLQVTRPTGGSAFVELLGSGVAQANELATLVEHAVGNCLRALHRAGEPAVIDRAVQVPRVEVVEPPKGAVLSKPTSMKLTWSVNFRRFDGELPTAGYPTTFTENEAQLRYVVLYSCDGGETWRNVVDHDIVEPGQWPTPGGSSFSDAGDGNESITVSLAPEKFPAGEVLFRVEAHRVAQQPHYGHHTVMVTVTR